MDQIGALFGKLLKLCHGIIPNYGWAIVLFTFFTRIILIPVSVMVQRNSIKMVKMYPKINEIQIKYFGNNDAISEERYNLYQEEKYNPILDLIPVIIQLILLMGVVEGVHNIIDTEKIMPFLGINLANIPINTGGIYFSVPFLAALSAFFMCITQNVSNVLQSEQSTANKTITLLISVGLSLYLGLFVPAGIGVYWIAGNLLSIIQMYVLNALINPRKYIDYDALERTKKELNQLREADKNQKKNRTKEEIRTEKADYKRFMQYGTKQIVFYSEKNGFYKYFKDIIEYILNKTDITVHYVTSDIHDEVMSLHSDSFRVYYVGENKLVVLMMKMDSDIVVMTMPDLQKYHIKRSLIRNDTEYIYIDHGINSLNMMLRKHAVDAFDTIFAANENVYREIRAQEAKYGLKEKHIVKYGYCLIDNMIRSHRNDVGVAAQTPTILIAPSWQKDNIMESCIEKILDELKETKYRIIVRPHPQYVRHYSGQIAQLSQKYREVPNVDIQTDFSSNKTVYDADILLTDWSGIAYEYAFTTLRPILYINTPVKIMNPDYREIDVEPLDLEIRSRIGIELELNELDQLQNAADRLSKEPDFNPKALEKVREQYLYNIGHSAEVGAKYIINRLIEYSQKVV